MRKSCAPSDRLIVQPRHRSAGAGGFFASLQAIHGGTSPYSREFTMVKWCTPDPPPAMTLSPSQPVIPSKVRSCTPLDSMIVCVDWWKVRFRNVRYDPLTLIVVELLEMTML